MGNKTVRRLAFLIGVIVFLGGGGYLPSGRFQVERMARGVVARAETAPRRRGNYAEAAELYAQHLAVVPDDVEVQIKYADAILKIDRSPKRLAGGAGDLRGRPGSVPGAGGRAAAGGGAGRRDGRGAERARDHLAILLKTAKDDGHLEYLMGRCDEQDKEYRQRREVLRAAVEHEAPERTRGLAAPGDAAPRQARPDGTRPIKVIDAMVKSASDDYRVYLGRGRYLELAARSNAGGKGGGRRFPQGAAAGPGPARGLPGGRRRGRCASRGSTRPAQVLDKGLAAVPKSAEPVPGPRQPRAEGRPRRPGGRCPGAGPEGQLPDELNLRWQLALLLADTGRRRAASCSCRSTSWRGSERAVCSRSI